MRPILALENLLKVDCRSSGKRTLNILYTPNWKNKNNPIGKFKENLLKQQTVFLRKREKNPKPAIL